MIRFILFIVMIRILGDYYCTITIKNYAYDFNNHLNYFVLIYYLIMMVYYSLSLDGYLQNILFLRGAPDIYLIAYATRLCSVNFWY
jgi:hypothetical protein